MPCAWDALRKATDVPNPGNGVLPGGSFQHSMAYGVPSSLIPLRPVAARLTSQGAPFAEQGHRVMRGRALPRGIAAPVRQEGWSMRLLTAICGVLAVLVLANAA